MHHWHWHARFGRIPESKLGVGNLLIFVQRIYVIVVPADRVTVMHHSEIRRFATLCHPNADERRTRNIARFGDNPETITRNRSALFREENLVSIAILVSQELRQRSRWIYRRGI